MGSCPSGLRQDGSSWGTGTCPCGTRGEPGSWPWPPRRRSSCVSVSPAPSLLTQHLCSFPWSLVLSLPFAAQLCPSLSLSRSLRPADNGTAESVSAAGVPRWWRWGGRRGRRGRPVGTACPVQQAAGLEGRGPWVLLTEPWLRSTQSDSHSGGEPAPPASPRYARSSVSGSKLGSRTGPCRLQGPLVEFCVPKRYPES